MNFIRVAKTLRSVTTVDVYRLSTSVAETNYSPRSSVYHYVVVQNYCVVFSPGSTPLVLVHPQSRRT